MINGGWGLGSRAAARAAPGRAELHLTAFDNVAVVNTLDALALATTAIERFDRGCVGDLALDTERCAELVAGHEAARNLAPRDSTTPEH